MTDNLHSDPLDKLFVDERQLVDKQLLADTILPFVRIFLDQGSAHIDFTKEGASLTVKQKILTYLLARKAVVLRNKDLLGRESISPKELETATGILGNTLRPILLQLKKGRLVQTDKSTEEGGYFIPNYAVHQAAEVINKEDR
jgi:hypothetical protein